MRWKQRVKSNKAANLLVKTGDGLLFAAFTLPLAFCLVGAMPLNMALGTLLSVSLLGGMVHHTGTKMKKALQSAGHGVAEFDVGEPPKNSFFKGLSAAMGFDRAVKRKSQSRFLSEKRQDRPKP